MSKKVRQGPRFRGPSKKQLDLEFAYFCPEQAEALGIPPPPPEFVEKMDREYASKAFPNMPPPPGYGERMRNKAR